MKKRTPRFRDQLMYGIAHDHSYYWTPKKETCLKKKVYALQQKLKNTRARLRNRSGQNKRLKDIITDLKNQHLIDTQAETLLQDSFSGMSLDLFRHVRRNAKHNEPCYLPKVRNFALSLHFLSPRAYDFIRPVLHLPHPRCLRRWKASVYCSPGYLENMLKVAAARARATESYHCSLIVDEMSLRKDISWVPSQNRYCGFTDFGQGPVGNSIASNVLLFMLVSLKGRWKAPVAYFLTDHISSTQLATCVREAICKAADNGLIVKTFVADGLRANVKAAIELGCNLDVYNLCTHFQHPHPRHRDEAVYFICDPPHMLKLFRNFLAERGIMKRATEHGVQTISWQYIKALHELQKTDSLYLAKKLTNKHINFNNVKMKVNIAAQTLSSSVATAIDHLRDDLKLPQFQGSEETCAFIRHIDRLFNLLNCKNPFAKGFKAALSERNQGNWKPFLQNIQLYLLSLQEPSGLPLHQGRRNQCVLGFMITARSTLKLAEDLLGKESYRYLLTYKFSQDHIEMFFGKIRQRSGWNNNPTSEQFRSALKSLMMSSTITPSRHGNAVPLDDTVELTLQPSSGLETAGNPLQTYDSELLTASSIFDSSLLDDTDWRQSCLYYTAGFVARRTVKRLCRCSFRQRVRITTKSIFTAQEFWRPKNSF
ncbi:THAP domain-containing protein 9 [Elysia marginata]|uniref:THAP domain-containing protein 9 n=1 Tax=Elysia marginata TaxID=1093978 RepID=A0AAV4EC22_9GAST|nr:THAP domain-containing protein 9 [Elysia marginata]